MKRYGNPHVVVTDKLRSYGAAMTEIGNAHRREIDRHLNNRAENSGIMAQTPLDFTRRVSGLQVFCPDGTSQHSSRSVAKAS